MAGEMHTYIAGAPHHPGARQRIASLRPGKALQLRREPGNPHDRNAVAVHDTRDDLKLGYVPRVDAPAVAKAIDTGMRVEAVFKSSTFIRINWEADNGIATL